MRRLIRSIIFIIFIFTCTSHVFAANNESQIYAVQVGVYSNEKNAKSMYENLKQNGFNDAYLTPVNGSYKVFAGRYNSKEVALNIKSKLDAMGISSYVTQILYSFVAQAPENMPKALESKPEDVEKKPKDQTKNQPSNQTTTQSNSNSESSKDNLNTTKPTESTKNNSEVATTKIPIPNKEAENKTEIFTIKADNEASHKEDNIPKNNSFEIDKVSAIILVGVVLFILAGLAFLFLWTKRKKNNRT